MSLAVFRKELRSIIKEKSFLSTVLMQVFLILFYSVAILGLLVIFNPESQMRHRISIFVIDNEYVDHDLLALLDWAEVTVGTRPGRHHAVLSFIDDDPIIINIYADQNSFRTAYMLSEMKKTLLRFEEDIKARGHPITKVSVLMDSAEVNLNQLTVMSLIFEFKYLLLVPLLLFLPIYLAGVLYIDLFSEEVAKKTLSLLVVSPVSLKGIINQKMLASLLLALAQVLAWLVILEIRGIAVANRPAILLLVSLTAGAVLLSSAAIALIFRHRAVAQAAFSFIVIAALVSKGFPFNPLNMITRLAVGEVSFMAVYMALGLVAAIGVLNLLVSRLCAAQRI